MSLLTDASQANWRKSSRSSSTGSDCVEVAALGGTIAVRDSKNPAGPHLFLSRTAWQNLANEVTAGEVHGVGSFTGH